MADPLDLTPEEQRRVAEAVQAYCRSLLRSGEQIDATLERVRRKILSSQRHQAGEIASQRRYWESTDEAAAALGVSKRTVQRRLRDGTLQHAIREA